MCVQAVPLGSPAAPEDFSERPTVNVVAGREVKLGAQSGSPRRRAILDRLSADLWEPRSEHGGDEFTSVFGDIADVTELLLARLGRE